MLTGRWSNYEELEASLSMDELLALLQAINKREYEQRRFMAALQGVDIDKSSSSTVPMQDGQVDLGALVERKRQEQRQQQLQTGDGFVADDAAEIMSLPGIEYGVG